jgi:hypothetical protein
LAAGDLDGDGRDDLVGIWSNAVWVRYGATGQWQQITASTPKWIATGKMTQTIQDSSLLEYPEAEVIIDMSQEGPGIGIAEAKLLRPTLFDRTKPEISGFMV